MNNYEELRLRDKLALETFNKTSKKLNLSVDQIRYILNVGINEFSNNHNCKDGNEDHFMINFYSLVNNNKKHDYCHCEDCLFTDKENKESVEETCINCQERFDNSNDLNDYKYCKDCSKKFGIDLCSSYTSYLTNFSIDPDLQSTITRRVIENLNISSDNSLETRKIIFQAFKELRYYLCEDQDFACNQNLLDNLFFLSSYDKCNHRSEESRTN